MNLFNQFLYNLLVLFSNGLNTLLLGTPHESISVRTAKAMRKNPNGWYKYHAHFINWLFKVIFKEEDHLKDALDGEDKAVEIWKWSK